MSKQACFSISVVVSTALLSASMTAGLGTAFAEPFDDVNSCSSQCMVGALGQGGISSDGRAQGSYRKGPGRIEGVNVRAAGTQASGRLELSGLFQGTLSGTFHGDTFRGRTTGPEFGDCTGSACTP
jgi:hypothetical protein